MRYPRTATPIVRIKIISDTQRTNPVAYVSLGTWYWVEKLARSDLNQCVEPNANPSRVTSRSCAHSRTRASAFAARAVAAPSLISLLLGTTRESAGPDLADPRNAEVRPLAGAPADPELSCATGRRAKQPRRRRDRCRREPPTFHRRRRRLLRSLHGYAAHDRCPEEAVAPRACAGASASPRTQPSCRGRADDCIARMMRKSNHARSPSDAALLLL